MADESVRYEHFHRPRVKMLTGDEGFRAAKEVLARINAPMNHFAKAADALDAAVFNGDGLLDADNRKAFKSLMERWQRKLVEWEKIAAEIAAETD